MPSVPNLGGNGQERTNLMYEDSHLEMDYEDRYPEYYDSDVWDAEDYEYYYDNADESDESDEPIGVALLGAVLDDADMTDYERDLDTWVNSPVRLPFGLIFS